MLKSLRKLSKTEKIEFAEWLYNYYNIHFRYGYLAFFFISASYTLVDFLYFPNYKIYSIIIRLIFGGIVLLMPILLSSFGYYKRHFLLINSFISTIIPISLIFLFAVFGQTNPHIVPIYFAGVILQILLIGLFIYKWLVALLASMTVSAFFVLINMYFNYNPSHFDFLIQEIIMIIVAGLITTLIAFYYQDIKTNMFISSKELLRDKIQIEEKNKIIEGKNKELIEANHSKDKLFSIIAHDLRSPFNGFIGLTTILSEELYDLKMTEIQEYSTELKKSAENLLLLLENLLSWSSFQRGMINYLPEKCELAFIIKYNISLLLDSAQKKEIEILNRISEESTIRADIQMINTIIRNLLSNALKFTPKKGRIEIYESDEIDTSFKRIYIKDTGIGIRFDIIDKLFDIDQKVSRPGTENEPSTGLGLVLCKEFIEKHGGKIQVESTEGKGSTFMFTMPKFK